MQAAAPAPAATRVEGVTGSYVRPADLAEALLLVGQHPDAVLVAGSTDWGVDVNLRGARTPLVIGIDRLEELRVLTHGPDHVEVGAALTLSELERRLAGEVPLLDAVLAQFASPLIRNGATVGGNLATGSPIGDLAPALLALEASVVLHGPDGERLVPLDRYFTGYRRSVRRADELIRAVRIPLPLARGRRASTRSPSGASTTSPASRSPWPWRRGGRRAPCPDRCRRHRGHPGARDRHRVGARGPAVDAGDRPGRRRRAARGGHADRRPPRQRRLPPGHPGHLLVRLHADGAGTASEGVGT